MVRGEEVGGMEAGGGVWKSLCGLKRGKDDFCS